jgi:hypothetical protein
MDMSNFHRKKRTGSPPDLSALLARVSALQAVSPTARIATEHYGAATPNTDMSPEIAPFAAPRTLAVTQKGRAASFNPVVAGALLTHGKGS